MCSCITVGAERTAAACRHCHRRCHSHSSSSSLPRAAATLTPAAATALCAGGGKHAHLPAERRPHQGPNRQPAGPHDHCGEGGAGHHPVLRLWRRCERDGGGGVRQHVSGCAVQPDAGTDCGFRVYAQVAARSRFNLTSTLTTQNAVQVTVVAASGRHRPLLLWRPDTAQRHQQRYNVAGTVPVGLLIGRVDDGGGEQCGGRRRRMWLGWIAGNTRHWRMQRLTRGWAVARSEIAGVHAL